MLRLVFSAFLLLSASWAGAQTIQITTSSGTCTYPTGPVKSDPSTPGQLLATATGAGTGAGCGSLSGGPSFGPAAPLAPATASLASTGGPQSFTFTAVNATSCTAALSGTATGSITSTGGATVCSSAATCTGVKTVTVNFAQNTSTTTDNTATVSVTCSSGAQQAVSSAAVTVVHSGGNPPPPPGCFQLHNGSGQAVNQLSGSINVAYSGSRTADPTSYDSMFGTFPGQAGIIVYPWIQPNQFISAGFKSINNYFTNLPNSVPDPYGEFYVSETGHSVAISMTISTSCGDFSNPTQQGSTVVPGCYVNKAATGGYLAWTKSTSCKLHDNQQYYLNIINADISNVTPNGGGTITTTYDSANRFCNVTQGCENPIQLLLSNP